MIDVSIIVPHYESVDLLEKLLKSIPNKNNIEVIVVDDKSKNQISNYRQLKNFYKDSNIKFLENNTEKKGAGVCRNIGIEKSLGKWILFADSDDYFTKDFYKILENYLDSENDVVFFIPTSIEVDTGEKSNRHVKYEKVIYDYIENKNLNSELSLRYRFDVPWSKLIRKDLIIDKNIIFDETIASNDVMFSTKVGYFMVKFEICKSTIYCVTRNKGSLTTNISDKVFDTRVDVFIRKAKFLKQNLTNVEYKILDISGQGFIFNCIKYKLGVKKLISTYKKISRNNVRVFSKKILNPIFLANKTINSYKNYNKNKKYMVKSEI